MAKSLYTIQMDFKKANECAAKLEEAAKKLKQCAQENFQNETKKLELYWKGENSTLYIGKCADIRHNMENTAKKTNANCQHSADGSKKYIRCRYACEEYCFDERKIN